MTYHRVCNKSNTTGATCGAGTGHLDWHPFRFLVAFVLLDLWFSVWRFVFCTSLFGLLSFIFWSLYCLSCVCLRLLITLLYLQSFLTYMWCFVIDLKWNCWYCWPSLYELYFHQYFKWRKCYKRGGGGGSISVYLAGIFDRFYYLGDIAIDYNYHKTDTFVFNFF